MPKEATNTTTTATVQVGDIVDVYQDPIAQLDFEGTARVVKVHSRDADFGASCDVCFTQYPEDGIVRRSVGARTKAGDELREESLYVRATVGMDKGCWPDLTVRERLERRRLWAAQEVSLINNVIRNKGL